MGLDDRNQPADPYAASRDEMIRSQIEARGINDPRVLAAIGRVPRHRFVPPPLRAQAYDDGALPIGPHQTISQPFIVAYMTWQLDLSDQARVLEIGTGTGYQTCILAHLARRVYSVELDAALAEAARLLLRDLGPENVTVRTGDGRLGWPEEAPFDRVIVTAGCTEVPPALLEQLAPDGLMVLPVGEPEHQVLVRIRKRGPAFIETPLIACRFVRLLGGDVRSEESLRPRGPGRTLRAGDG